MDIHILSHSKYRRLAFYGKYKREIEKILRTICERKGVTILEAELCTDHIHMLVEIPPKYSVSSFMGELKVKSGFMIFDQFTNLKYKYRNRHFWASGFFADTVGKDTKMIQEYIQNHLSDDKLADQMSTKELIDPFT